MTSAAPPSADACYRHPDRPSYILCQRCGRTICPECQTVAPVGVQCPDCIAQARQASPQVRRAQRNDSPIGRALNPVGGRPIVTWTIIALCVAVSLLQLVLGSGFTRAMLYFPPWTLDEPWRLVTSMFTHSQIVLTQPVTALHLAFNMYALVIIGPVLERALGRGRFLALYLLAGYGGSVAVALLAPETAVVGASGAIFGMFGAYFIIMRSLGGRGMQVLIVIGINLVIGFIIPSIAWQAHVGGLIAGAAVAGLYLVTRRAGRAWLRRLGLAAIAVVLTLLLLVAVAAIV